MTAGFTARHPRLVRALATGFIALAALLAAVWLAPRASGTAATWLRTPAVHLRTLHAPGDGALRVAAASAGPRPPPLTLDAGMRFTMAGVVCDRLSTGSATIRLRTSLDGVTWSRWYRAPLEVADETGPAEAFTDPVWTGDARYVQVAATAGSRRAPARLSGVRLVAIDPTGGPASPPASGTPCAAPPPRWPAWTSSSRRSPPRRSPSSSPAPSGAPTRSSARAPPRTRRSRWPSCTTRPAATPTRRPTGARARTRHLRVPHPGPGLERHRLQLPRRPLRHHLRGQVRRHHPRRRRGAGLRVQHRQHRHLRHGDLHRRGAAGRGRHGAGAPARLEAERRGSRRRGHGHAHLRRRREVQDRAPSSPSRSSPATGRPTTPSARATRSTPSSPPSAPTWPGAWAAGAEAAASPRRSAPSTALISPNNDGLLDTVDLAVSLSAAADWRLVVRDGSGQAVASWSGSGQTSSVRWDGASGGATVPDGAYTAELTAGTDATAAPVTLTVDTSAPRLASAAATPLRFSPDGDGRADTCAVTYSPAEACEHPGRRPGRRRRRRPLAPGVARRRAQEYSVSWDGRVTSGSALAAAADGQYRFDIERRDAGGNAPVAASRSWSTAPSASPWPPPPRSRPTADGASDTTKSSSSSRARRASPCGSPLGTRSCARSSSARSRPARAASRGTARPARATPSPTAGPSTPSRPPRRSARAA